MASMPEAAMKLLLVRPAVPAPLDPNFSPLVLAKRKYLKAVAAASGTWEGFMGYIFPGHLVNFTLACFFPNQHTQQSMLLRSSRDFFGTVVALGPSRKCRVRRHSGFVGT